MRGPVASLLLAMVLATGTACMGTTQRREDRLLREARTFNDDLRWARWEAVSAAMPKQDGEAFMGRVTVLDEELVLADHEVTSINFAAGSEAATVVARFVWFTRRDPVVRNTTIEQRWEYRDGVWRVVGLRRTRGDRIGLVTEPTEKSSTP